MALTHCPSCKEKLSQKEADFMSKNGYTECVKCRAAKEPPVVQDLGKARYTLHHQAAATRTYEK